MVNDEPLLIQWGILDFLEGYSGNSNTGIDRTSVWTHDRTQTVYEQPGESYPVRGYTSVESDGVIAEALQEEFVDEASQKPQGWAEWAGLFADTWLTGRTPNACDTSSSFDYGSGQESEDDGMHEMSDYFASYDGEVGKRLTHMDSIPHLPKINGEIPTIDDASAAHRRLIDRLNEYGLMELKVEGDGNCQFRAFSDQLYRTSAHHKSVRDDVVTQLTSCPELYEGYVPMKYRDYVTKMSRSGEWGDHVTLQAAADFYGVTINLLTSFKDTSFIQILPRQSKSKRVVNLSFWAEVHYNSIYALGEIPSY